MSVSVQVNVASLETVVRGYLRKAELKTEAARKESQEAVEEVDDLENLVSPEQLLLRSVSQPQAGQVRSVSQPRAAAAQVSQSLSVSVCVSPEQLLLRSVSQPQAAAAQVSQSGLNVCLCQPTLIH